MSGVMVLVFITGRADMVPEFWWTAQGSSCPDSFRCQRGNYAGEVGPTMIVVDRYVMRRDFDGFSLVNGILNGGQVDGSTAAQQSKTGMPGLGFGHVPAQHDALRFACHACHTCHHTWLRCFFNAISLAAQTL